MPVGFSSIGAGALGGDDLSTLVGASGPDLTRYLVVCGLLLALFAALGFGFRRLLAGNLRGRAAKRSLQTLDVLPLGSKQRLAVVRCYDRSYLIGIGEKEISLLAELDADELPTTELEAAEPSAVGHTAGGFLRSLKREELRARSVPEQEPRRVRQAIGGGRGILG